jgi:hypothetical protein
VILESIGYHSAEPHSQALPPGIGLVYREQARRIKARGAVGDWTLLVYRGASTALARDVGEAIAQVSGPDAVVLTRDPLDLPVTGRVLALLPWAEDFTRSDHLEFWKAGVPAIQVTDTANFRNPNYHRPSDTPGTLDYARLAATTAALAAFAGWPRDPSSAAPAARRAGVPGKEEP